ncbi:MAG: hypothetical protein RIG62_28090 [Cyclobacteriaceae bacterium]
MKLIHILFSSLFSIGLLSGCQSEEVAPLNLTSTPLVVEKGFTEVRQVMTPSVVRTEYPGAIKWEITMDVDGLDYVPDWYYDYKYHFSIIHESFQSINDMNMSARNTAAADIALNCFDFVSIDAIGDKLLYPAYARTTWFKTIKIRPTMIEYMTTTAPELFQSKYEHSAVEATKQVSNFEEAMQDIHLFKTSQASPRYGLLRMVERKYADTGHPGFRYYGKIELVVQK